MMKNKQVYFFLAALLFSLPAFLQAQPLSAVDFFKSDAVPATYLGIEFTLAKLIHDAESNPAIIQSQQFNGINDLIVKEYKKFDVQEAYHRTSWTVDLKEVEARNLKADPNQLMSSNDADLHRLKKTDIDQLISHFNYGSNKGYGILLVVEGMDKTAKMATIWFTLIDMNTKKVLVTDLVEGKLGSGFGFRNYWSSAIKNAINAVKSKNYDLWKASAGVN
jgi:hypothetical protein